MVQENCIECDEKATYVRSTQFAGDHYYCTYHAHKQSDFFSPPDSYSYWSKLEEENWDNWKPNKDIV